MNISDYMKENEEVQKLVSSLKTKIELLDKQKEKAKEEYDKELIEYFINQGLLIEEETILDTPYSRDRFLFMGYKKNKVKLKKIGNKRCFYTNFSSYYNIYASSYKELSDISKKILGFKE